MAAATPLALSFFLFFASSFFVAAYGFGVLQLHRIPDDNMTLDHKISRDLIRHARMLTPFDLKVGGLGGTYQVSGLYYAVINIGTPPKTFRVQIDSGSDLLWLSCSGCKSCPQNSTLGYEITLYDEKASSTSRKVGCDHKMCAIINKGDANGTCQEPDGSCPFSMVYVDQSTSSGHLVEDNLQFVTTDAKNDSASLVFGCGVDVTGSLLPPYQAVDGVFGFGRAEGSFISQLATQGKTKKIFSHCLDNRNGGGGMLTIGEVALPPVKRTKMLVEYADYRVSLKNVAMGGQVLDLPSELFEDGPSKGAAVESAFSFSTVPKAAFDEIVKVINNIVKPSAGLQGGIPCYSNDYDLNKLPNMTFNFADDAVLTLSPADYLTASTRAGLRCLAFISLDQSAKDTEKKYKDMFVFGESALANKVILYDIENSAIGFSDAYNCSNLHY